MGSLIKSSGMPSIRSLMEDFWTSENLLDRAFRRDVLPAVNIKENEGNFEIEVAAPGFQKQDFKVDIQNGVLNISAETSEESTEDKDNYTRKEFSYSSFNRSFSLPKNIKEENVQARYENGVLKLKLEKSQKDEPQKKSISIE
ncbi:Hsp20/alpha crystallin family protein [Pedobacter sp. P351]|uniref:Hsp20/alpha crystallin family protein n=1 Tax=Pedobacter superstes TaxID=3133441 RepID=UPI0030B50E51